MRTHIIASILFAISTGEFDSCPLRPRRTPVEEAHTLVSTLYSTFQDNVDTIVFLSRHLPLSLSFYLSLSVFMHFFDIIINSIRDQSCA